MTPTENYSNKRCQRWLAHADRWRSRSRDWSSKAGAYAADGRWTMAGYAYQIAHENDEVADWWLRFALEHGVDA